MPLLGGNTILAGGLWRAQASEQTISAETESGRVRGATVRGVHIFRGIPEVLAKVHADIKQREVDQQKAAADAVASKLKKRQVEARKLIESL